MRSALEGIVATLLLGVALMLIVGGAAAAPDSTAPRVYSIKDSPGYVPKVDPESASVALGRRPHAPLVSKRFKGGARSLDELGRAVCRALHRGNRDSLMALCVSEDEFRDVMWNEFPQSRPATGLTWEDAWRVLYVRQLSGCNGATVDFGNHYYDSVRLQSGSTKVFKNFKLHNEVTLMAKDDDGVMRQMVWIRSVVERKGSFKIYSTDD